MSCNNMRIIISSSTTRIRLPLAVMPLLPSAELVGWPPIGTGCSCSGYHGLYCKDRGSVSLGLWRVHEGLLAPVQINGVLRNFGLGENSRLNRGRTRRGPATHK